MDLKSSGIEPAQNKIVYSTLKAALSLVKQLNKRKRDRRVFMD
jgi:hypothetical protein